jgi:hypothetical protein
MYQNTPSITICFNLDSNRPGNWAAFILSSNLLNHFSLKYSNKNIQTLNIQVIFNHVFNSTSPYRRCEFLRVRLSSMFFLVNRHI